MKKYLQRFIIMMMSLTLMFSSSFPVFAAESAQKTGVNMGIGIFINGTMLVPLRNIADALNTEITWNEKEQSITLKREGASVFMKIGDSTVQVNGQTKTLEVPPQIEDGQTFVPLRLIGEAFGANVEWNAEKQYATVQTKDKALYISGFPYFEWEGNHFVYMGDLENGLPQGEGSAVLGTSFTNDVWYTGPWDQGKPVNLLNDDYKIYVNGDYLKSDYPPIVRNDVVYIPLWSLLSKLRMSAQPIGDVLRINHPNRIILIGSNSTAISYFGGKMDPHLDRMSYPIISEQEVLYAPISFLTDYLDMQTAWGDNHRIDITAGDFTKDISWGDNNKINSAAKQLQLDIVMETFWKQNADSLWSGDLPYPSDIKPEDRFNQYEKLSVISYSGLEATLSNGSKTIRFKFSVPSSLTGALYIGDPLAGFDWSEDIKDLIRRKKVRIDMTKDQVLMSWGKPDSVNVYGTMEQWVYRYGSSFGAQYLYFTKGVLTSTQS
ncbi:copper amine oxidase N-terminal domain-containing protein [Paenibacillus sp. UNC451MF]|uniref:copper amine oxidase N-terminal domain-containing protein n=1 Tax=Paenibacillus sp. UNC451MF TaxID=1449063 RepID=UPI0004900C60|nr:copper amine oxidase N-terminal domain-containing protein [Paenibacillus sp. UNC451MF]